MTKLQRFRLAPPSFYLTLSSLSVLALFPVAQSSGQEGFDQQKVDLKLDLLLDPPEKIADPAAKPEAEAKAAPTPWLGVQMEQKSLTELDDDEAPQPGIGVLAAVENSPAAKAGIQAMDRILKVGDKEIQDEIDLRSTVRQHKPGTVLDVIVLRVAEKIPLKVTLEAMPENQLALGGLGAFPGFGGLGGISGGPIQDADFVKFLQGPTALKQQATQPDVIELLDGNRITGTILKLTDADLTVKLESGMEMVLDAQQVASLRQGSAFQGQPSVASLSLQNGGNLEVSALALANGQFSVALGAPETTALPASAVRALQADPTGKGVYYRSGPSDQTWTTSPAGSWENKNGTWSADKNRGGTLAKKFTQLPDGLEFSFDVPSRDLWGVPLLSISLFAQRINGSDFANSPGMLSIDLNGQAVNVSQFDGRNFVNNVQPTDRTAGTIPKAMVDAKNRHISICVRRTTGKMLIQVDGIVIGVYKLAKIRPADFAAGQCGRVIRIRSNQGEASISNILIRSWLDELPTLQEAPGNKLAVMHPAGGYFQPEALTAISDQALTFQGHDPLPTTQPYLVEFPAVPSPAPLTDKSAPSCWVELKNGSSFPADALVLTEQKLQVRLVGQQSWELPASAFRSVSYLGRTAKPAHNGNDADVITLRDTHNLRGKISPSETAGQFAVSIPAARTPITLAENEISGILFRQPLDIRLPEQLQVLRLANGDWFPAELLELTAQNATINTPFQKSLKLETSQLHEFYPSASADVIADAASGLKPWKYRIGLPNTPLEEEPSVGNNWLYHNGTYTQANQASTGQRSVRGSIVIMGGTYYGSTTTAEALSMPLPEMKASTSVEFELSSPNNWANLNFTNAQGSPLFSVYYTGSSVQLTRSYVSNEGRGKGGFVRPEQFVFNIPGIDARLYTPRKTPIKFQFGFTPRQDQITVSLDGKFVGKCKLLHEFPWSDVRLLRFGGDSWGGSTGKLSVGNTWIAPWIDASTDAAPLDPKAKVGESEVFLANGDSAIGMLTSKNPTTLTLNCEAGEIPLPHSRVHVVTWKTPLAPKPEFPHRIRLLPRGQISASAMRWEGQEIVATTPYGEIRIAKSQVKELVWGKS